MCKGLGYDMAQAARKAQDDEDTATAAAVLAVKTAYEAKA
jgi:hypothetical protein